jgi:hypothetical protein
LSQLGIKTRPSNGYAFAAAADQRWLMSRASISCPHVHRNAVTDADRRSSGVPPAMRTPSFTAWQTRSSVYAGIARWQNLLCL